MVDDISKISLLIFAIKDFFENISKHKYFNNHLEYFYLFLKGYKSEFIGNFIEGFSIFVNYNVKTFYL